MNDGTLTRIGSYEVLGLLGEGGMGQIYRARDTRLDRLVAIKVLSDRLTQDPTAVERFVGEARAASALNHPNIVTIYEVGEVNGRHFIAMEFVDGTTLRPLLAHAGALERFQDLASQIARALAAAHAAGIVHRDIKPENIMVRPDGYLKVVDFGIASLMRVDGIQTSGLTTSATGPSMLLGTPRYMSPEQIRGERVGSESDVFSLGIIAYEWATGRHPFGGDVAIDVLRAITAEDLAAPSRINLEVPPALDTLILEMLQKDPARRPTAAEIVRRLATPVDTVSPPVVSGPTTVDHERVGRLRESTELHAAFDAVVRGQGGLVGVAGEPGIGKTTLVEDTLRDIARGGVPAYLARGRCSERLAGAEAYLPFLEAFDSLLRDEGRETVARIFKSVAPAWYSQLAMTAEAQAGQELKTQAGSQERLKRELLAVLEELSRLRPVVLFFDDVHWADASTVDLLAYVAGRFARLRVLVIATYRPNELQRGSHPFLAVMRDLQARGDGRELAVDFLTQDETSRYLALNFPGHRFPPGLATLIQDKTEGNPLFMVDMVRDLRHRTVIVQAADGWELTQEISEVARELPASIRSMIQRKIDALSEEEKRLLVTASVQGVRLDTAVVARALDTDPDGLEEQLDRLERLHGFVRLTGDQRLPDGTPSSQYRFVHALYQNQLYASLRPVRRVRLSGVVARALEGFHAKDTAPIATELAFLFEAAQDHGASARYFFAAAQRAIEVCGYREAIVLCRRGLAVAGQMPPLPDRTKVELELHLALGTSLAATKGYAAPDVEEVMTRARALCASGGEPQRLFRAVETLWGFYFAKGDLVKASDLGDELLTIAAEAGDDRMMAVAHQNVGFPLTQRGRPAEGLVHLDEALTFSEEASHPKFGGVTRVDATARALVWSSMALWLIGLADQANARLRRALERAAAIGHPFTHAFACSIAGWCCHHRRDPLGVQRAAEKALSLSTEYSLGQWVPIAHVLLGWVKADQGRVDDGIAEIQQGIDMFKRTGATVNLPQFLSMLAEAYVRDGRFAEGLAAVDEGLVLADKNSDLYWKPELLRLKGALTLEISGSEEAAEACFNDAIGLSRRQQARLLELRTQVSLSRLWQRQGRGRQAHDALAAVYDAFAEGFETSDLRDARALLAVLAENRPA